MASGQASRRYVATIPIHHCILIDLILGVATGVEGLNEELRYKLEVAEKELIAKKQELDAAQRTIGDLQRKMNATQP